MTEQILKDENKDRKKPKRHTLSVNDENYYRLQKIGKYGDSANDIIKKCLDSYEKVLAAITTK